MELSEKDVTCYVCGSENDVGLHVPFVAHGQSGSLARYTVQPQHTGWKGLLHGGLAFTLMDEALGWALYYQGLRGLTAKAEARFRAPMPVGTPLLITAFIVERARRIVRANAQVRRDGGAGEVLAELKATLYLALDARLEDTSPGI